MSVESGVDAFFERRRQDHRNECSGLKKIIEKMISHPGTYSGPLYGFGTSKESSYPGNCEDVNRFVREHNADHPKLTFDVQYGQRLWDVRTTLDEKNQTIVYRIY